MYQNAAGEKSMPVSDAVLTALGEGRDADLAAASGLPSIPTGARWALLSVEAQPVRVRFAGGTATSTSGVLFPAGSIFGISSNLSDVSVIETTAGAAISVAYFK